MTSSAIYPKDLFKGTASYYARHRPHYPEAFLSLIAQRFGLDGTGRLLDLGCGTGQLAVPLGRHFEQVVAMDPEPEMLAEARNFARLRGVRNIEYVEGGSNDLEGLKPGLGRFRLVTMGESFHWMDRDATLGSLHDMIEGGGGVAVCIIDTTTPTKQPRSDWTKAAMEVVRRHLGERRRAGSGYYSRPEERHETVVARSRFHRVETVGRDGAFSFATRRNIEAVLGWLYSTSYASLHVLGDKREAFERDVRETLLSINPDGWFDEENKLEGILAWKEKT